MRRKAIVIGIGAGNPDYLTLQAVEAMNRAEVFFIPNKGADKRELAELRRQMLERHVRGDYRLVEFDIPTRRAAGDDYDGAVDEWHAAIAGRYATMLADELDESQTGAFLVWGDPAFYDSVIRILERVAASGRIELDYEVIPGISAIQALASRHRTPLNAIGKAVLISSGRTKGDVFPDIADSAVFMLNADKALRAVEGDPDIFWGAYLGMEQEILVSGRLSEVAAEIEEKRAAARAANGWIMDTVLMKRRVD